MKLFFGILLLIVAQIISYFQLQGYNKWDFFNKNVFILCLVGVPVSFLYIVATRLINEHFYSTWEGRLIGQSVGVIVFSIMSFLFLKEGLGFKTITSILLSFLIILINIFKNE